MRILLVGNYAPDAQRSMIAYAEALERGLKERGIDARLIAATPRLIGRRASTHGVGKWLGYLDKFVLFLPELRREGRKADLVHVCDQGNGMLIPSLRAFRNLITCHDVIAIDHALNDAYGGGIGPTGQLFQRLNLNGLKRAKDVVCVSETTRKRLQELAPRLPETTTLVRNGLLDRYPDQSGGRLDELLEAQGLAPGTRYLFHIGNNSAYKNRPGAVRIFALLKQRPEFANVQLVLAGKSPDEPLRDAIRDSGIADAITVLVDVDSDTKAALYRRALALLFPSSVEGFGLPIIEAQSLGCPVITTAWGPMDEVAGGAALLIDPNDEDEAARKIAEALPRLDELTRAGHENAALYTEQRMIDGYLDVYRRILDRS